MRSDILMMRYTVCLQAHLQAIVVAPSRELAMQIMRVGQAILPNEAKGCVQQAIGGANPRRQVCNSKLPPCMPKV